MTILKVKDNSMLKKLVWAYLLLLIFEGALRKWVVPGLAMPLLLVRDPLAILLMYKATRLNISWMNNYIRVAWFTTALSFVFSLLIGHQNILVAIFGARILFLHFPLVFVIAKVLHKNDVLKMGRIIMLVSIPMTVLVALQFYSPQTAWVNRGVGGDLSGAGFIGAMGYFRPSGTFSFTNGNVLFYGLCSCFIFYFALSKEKCSKLLLICSSIAFVLAIPLSISRTLVFGTILSIVFIVFASFRYPKISYGIIKASLIVLLVFSFLQTISTFKIAADVMVSRFESAGKAEGGNIEGTLGKRFLGSLFDPILTAIDKPFIEGKLGMGTNVGSRLLGQQGFLISETEWGRLTGERGSILGLIVIALRFILIISISVKSWFLVKQREILSWFILSYTFFLIVQGQWAQPTSLGFAIFSAGLVMASFNHKTLNKNSINRL